MWIGPIGLFLWMAGPYVKKGYVSNTHAILGHFKNDVQHIENVPYVNSVMMLRRPNFRISLTSEPTSHLIPWERHDDTYV